MKIFKEFATLHVAKMTTFLTRKFGKSGFRPRMTYDETKERSEGGVKVGKTVVPVLHINTAYLVKLYKRGDWKFKYEEYRHIANRADIGSFTGSWQQFMMAILCHEMAHAYVLWRVANGIDVIVPSTFRESPEPDGDWHDAEWQHVYSLLRAEFLVPMQRKQRDLDDLFLLDD